MIPTVLFEGILGLGLLCLLVPVFAEFGKFKGKAERAYRWIAVGGVSFILSFAFTVEFWGKFGAQQIANYAGWLFQFIGWAFVLAGALYLMLHAGKK